MPTDPHASRTSPDIDEGDDCTDPDCPGRYEFAYPPSHSGSCSCHLSPTCFYCTEMPLICSECLEEADPVRTDILPPPREGPAIVTTIVYDSAGRHIVLTYPHNTKPMLLTAKDIGLHDS